VSPLAAYCLGNVATLNPDYPITWVLGRVRQTSRHRTIRLPNVAFGSKARRTQHEHMSSGLPSKADIGRI
jgi:hypothetical protein